MMGAILVSGSGVVDGDCALSPRDVVRQYPQGAYTTALVLDHHDVVDWDLHLQRLVKNVEHLHTQRPPSFHKLMQWCRDHQGDLPALLEARVQPQVAAALCALAAVPSGTAQSQPSMLTVIVSEVTGGWDSCTTPPVETVVYCAHVPPSAESVPVTVMVHGAPRHWAHAKHCQWVVDRRALEDIKPPEVSEIILSSAEGELVEGLVSNFYVVTPRNGVEPISCNDPIQDFELHTSGPSQPALLGITQQRILQACADIGLQVKLSAPMMADRYTWQEAFITNW